MRIYLHWKCWPSSHLFRSIWYACVSVSFSFFLRAAQVFKGPPKKKRKNMKNSPSRILRPNKLCYFCASFFDCLHFLDLGRCVWREWTFQGETRKNSQSENRENVGRGKLQKKERRTGTSAWVCVFVSVRLPRCVCAGERVIGIE